MFTVIKNTQAAKQSFNVLYPKNCFHLFNPGKNLNKKFLVW